MSKILYAACATLLLAAFGTAWATQSKDAFSDIPASSSTFIGDQSYDTRRVVCVSKQINEFIYEIGAQNHLVAHDLTSVYPPQIKKLPSVGYHRALSAEGIISMQPTVFLTDGNMGPQAVLGQLKEVGIPVKVITPGKSMADAQPT